MNATRNRIPTASAVAIAIAALAFAGCSAGSGSLVPATPPQAAAANSGTSIHKDTLGFPSGTYTMLVPMALAKGATAPTFASTAAASCAGTVTSSGTPLTVSEQYETSISPATVTGFTCAGNAKAGTKTNYYIVMVTNPGKTTSDATAQPVAGPATQTGYTLSFPVLVKGITISPNTPTYFYVAYY